MSQIRTQLVWRHIVSRTMNTFLTLYLYVVHLFITIIAPEILKDYIYWFWLLWYTKLIDWRNYILYGCINLYNKMENTVYYRLFVLFTLYVKDFYHKMKSMYLHTYTCCNKYTSLAPSRSSRSLLHEFYLVVQVLLWWEPQITIIAAFKTVKIYFYSAHTFSVFYKTLITM